MRYQPLRLIHQLKQKARDLGLLNGVEPRHTELRADLAVHMLAVCMKPFAVLKQYNAVFPASSKSID
jgi:hypothetical protein